MKLRFWETRTWEKYYPFYGGFGALIFVPLLFFYECTLPNRIQEVPVALLNLGAIATGFLGTVGAILLTYTKPILDAMKRTKEYDLLMDYIAQAIRWSLALSVYAGIGMLPSYKCFDWWDKIYLVLLAFLMATCLLMCYRVVVIFCMIIRARN